MDNSSHIPALIQRRYRFLEVIGRGGMGEVALVEDLANGRQQLAMKWVKSSDPMSSHEMRHLREYEVLSRFQHPNILPVYNYGIVEPCVGRYFTAERLNGPALSGVMNSGDMAAGMNAIVQILRALQFMHEQSWVHADIKPENILLRRESCNSPSNACLIDFGISHPIGRPPEEKLLGTVFYIPPERFLGAHLNATGDLYSVGIMLYQLFTGQVPFIGPDKRQVLEGHIRGIPVAPSAMGAEISDSCEKLVLALLEKNPEHRPQSAVEVIKELQTELKCKSERETKASTRAYIQVFDDTGWEEPLRFVTTHIRQRCEHRDDTRLNILADTLYQQEAFGEVLLPQKSEHSTCGLIRVKCRTRESSQRFQSQILQRLAVYGVPVVKVDSGVGGSPMADLVRGIMSFLPGAKLREDPFFRELLKRISIRSKESEIQVKQVASWLNAVGLQQSFVVLVESLNAKNSSLVRLFKVLQEYESQLPGVQNIAWVMCDGYKGQQSLDAGLFLQFGEWCKEADVPNLDPLEITQWLERRFDNWEMPKQFRSLLENESHGDPALLERILCAFIDEGILLRGWDGWSLAEAGGLSVPASPLVVRCIRAFREESAAARLILESLAVLSGSSDLVWIERVSGLQPKSLLPLISELQERCWIEKEASGLRFRFVYPYQQIAIHMATDTVRWAENNRRVYDMLKQRQATGMKTSAARLAEHLLAAGQIEQAMVFAREEASTALKQRRGLDSLRWLEMVLDHADAISLQDRVEAYMELADMREEWGPPREVLRLRRIACELNGGRHPVALDLERKLAASEGFRGDFKRAFDRLQKLLSELPVNVSTDEHRRILLLLLELNTHRGGNKAVNQICGYLDQLDKSSDPNLIGQESFLRSEEARLQSANEQARMLLRRGAIQLDSDTSPIGAAWCVFLTARWHALKGLWEQAICEYRLAAKLFAGCRNSRRQAQSLVYLAELQQELSLHAESELAFKHAQGIYKRLGTVVESLPIQYMRAISLMHKGWQEEALSQLQQLIQWGSRYPGTKWQWEAYLACATIEYQRGQLGRCGNLLAGAAHPEHAPHSSGPEPWFRWSRLATQYSIAKGSPDEALGCNDSALRQLKDQGAIRHLLLLSVDRLRLLKSLGCRDAAQKLQSRLEGHRQQVSHSARFLTDTLEQSGESVFGVEESVWATYIEGKKVSSKGDETGAVHLFDAAHDNALRIQSKALAGLIRAHIAVLQSDPKDAESWMRRAWKSFCNTGIQRGRCELLLLWAKIKRDMGDSIAARALETACVRRFELWSSQIPFEHNRSDLASWLGLDPSFAEKFLIQEVTP